MRGRLTDRGWRPLAYISAGLYVVFLLTVPFEHHDFLCHLKAPQHCTACTSSLLGSDPHTPVVPGAWNLSDTGRAITLQTIANGTLLPVRSTGRSPPLQF